MFDPIVQVKVSEIERVFAIAPLQHIRSEIGDKEAEAGGKVVRRPDFCAEFIELDVFAVTREYA